MSLISKRRFYCELQQAVDIPEGGAGGQVRDFTTITTLWTAIEPLDTANLFYLNERGSRASHKIHMVWRPDIEPGMRIKTPTRIFHILNVHDPDGRRRDLVCLAREGG